MAVTVKSKKYRIQNVSANAAKVRMVFTAGTTVGTFTDIDLTANEAHVIATARLSTTTVAISDAAPGVTVTVNQDDTVDLDIVGGIDLV